MSYMNLGSSRVGVVLAGSLRAGQVFLWTMVRHGWKPVLMTEEGKCAIHDASKGTNLADWRRAILHVTLCASTNSSKTADISPNLMRASIFDFTHNCNSEIAKWSTLW